MLDEIILIIIIIMTRCGKESLPYECIQLSEVFLEEDEYDDGAIR